MPSDWLPPYLSWGLCLCPYLSFNLFGRLIMIWQLHLHPKRYQIEFEDGSVGKALKANNLRARDAM